MKAESYTLYHKTASGEWKTFGLSTEFRSAVERIMEREGLDPRPYLTLSLLTTMEVAGESWVFEAPNHTTYKVTARAV